MESIGSAKRIMARQKATSIRQLEDQEVAAVNGGASFVPTTPGADMEILPGVYGMPWEPDWPSDGEIKTLGINEN